MRDGLCQLESMPGLSLAVGNHVVMLPQMKRPAAIIYRVPAKSVDRCCE